MSTRPTLAFLKTETGSGLLLGAAALVAVIWANSPFAADYARFIDHAIRLQLGPFVEEMTLAGWVRSALMPVFFFVVGLEIKHEILKGELANPRRLAMPLLAAAGGAVAPAAAYVALNLHGEAGGWPVTAGTDLAFALAVFALAGPRVPPTLRVLLMTVAILDDILAVGLIGVLFSHRLQLSMVVGAAATLALLAAMSRWRTAPYSFWALGWLLLWGFTLKAGIDPSIAGIAAAAFVPPRAKRAGGQDVLTEMMDALHPYVAFFILPLFALTAAGFAFRGDLAEQVLGRISLGVAAGLFLGKQAGVLGAIALALGLKWARRPTGAKWLDLWGVAALTGVGFTMALYIGALAFPAADARMLAEVRAGVVLGSLASGLLGLGLLTLGAARRGR
jgi:NhaA family Na+:H+ antiporter